MTVGPKSWVFPAREHRQSRRATPKILIPCWYLQDKDEKKDDKVDKDRRMTKMRRRTASLEQVLPRQVLGRNLPISQSSGARRRRRTAR
jgi:hypothetical protein